MYLLPEVKNSSRNKSAPGIKANSKQSCQKCLENYLIQKDTFVYFDD